MNNLNKIIQDYPGRVPEFTKHCPCFEDLNEAQYLFLSAWLAAYASGNPIDVQGNIGYLFIATYIIIRQNEPRVAIIQLREIVDIYNHESKFVAVTQNWIADLYLSEGDKYSYIKHSIRPAFASKRISFYEPRISIKLILDKGLDIHDLLGLFGKSILRKYARENLNQFERYCTNTVFDLSSLNPAHMPVELSVNNIFILSGVPVYIHPEVHKFRNFKERYKHSCSVQYYELLSNKYFMAEAKKIIKQAEADFMRSI